MRSERQEIKDVYQKVKLYLSVNRFDAAQKLLQATLADHGPVANIHNLLGVTYHQQSMFPEAIKEFRRAISINSAFVEAGLNLAATLCDLGHYDSAQQVHKDVLAQLNPRQKQPDLILGRIANQHVLNGEAYRESDMIPDAIQEFRKAISLYPNMPDVRLSLAKLYVHVGQMEKARIELEEIIRLDENPPEAHTWLGIVYYKLEKYDDARIHWEKAKSVGPDLSAPRAYLKLVQTSLT